MDIVRAVGEWLGNNWSGVGTLLFTAVVAWTAIIGHRLNRHLTDAELDPAITVYLEPDPHEFSSLELVVKNVGRGTARNISLRASPDVLLEPGDDTSRLSALAIFQRGIPFMAPSQEIRTLYGAYPQVQEEPVMIDVVFDRDTTERRRRTLTARFLIDARQFEGLSQLGDPPDVAVANALERIARDVHQLRLGSGRTLNITRRYVFSNSVDRMRRRWFGRRTLGKRDPWGHFRAELRRTLAARWERLRR